MIGKSVMTDKFDLNHSSIMMIQLSISLHMFVCVSFICM